MTTGEFQRLSRGRKEALGKRMRAMNGACAAQRFSLRDAGHAPGPRKSECLGRVLLSYDVGGSERVISIAISSASS